MWDAVQNGDFLSDYDDGVDQKKAGTASKETKITKQ